MSVELSLLDPGMEYPGRKQFDCGHAIINKFVRDSLLAQVKKKLSVAYVLTDPLENGRLVGFFTIANHAIDATSLSSLQLGSLPRKISCVRLGMLGIDKHYKKQKFGSLLMKQALVITKTSSNQIGCFGLYLDADACAVGFYQKLGFVLLEGNKSPEPSPMFIAVRSIA
jgi:GNAT superfamily N-acetyltransferase